MQAWRTRRPRGRWGEDEGCEWGPLMPPFQQTPIFPPSLGCALRRHITPFMSQLTLFPQPSPALWASP